MASNFRMKYGIVLVNIEFDDKQKEKSDHPHLGGPEAASVDNCTRF